MSNEEKKKLCWNCEGSVLRSASNCPFCGVYLHPEEEDTRSISKNLDPPYPNRETAKIPISPYANHKNNSIAEEEKEVANVAVNKSGWKTVIAPLTFLLSGSVFFLFGFLMLLFSVDGWFTLQWNSDYWYIYLLISIPLLYFGWQTLENINED